MGPKGEAKDTVATSPKEVYSIIRKVFGKIYKGNCEDQNETARNYIESYGRYLFRGKTGQITPLTGRDLQITAGDLRVSAAGLDNWAPEELMLLPIEAYEQLAVLLNMVEAVAPWPEDMTKARAAFLAKDPDDELNPLAYRVLLMLSGVYRMWSKTRLRHMQPWVETWTLPEMFA